MNNLINLFLDEAHIVKEWGGTFHSNYLQIRPIHYLTYHMKAYSRYIWAQQLYHHLMLKR